MKDIVENQISEAVIGAAIEVHKTLGPGLLESAYKSCLAHELALRSIPVDVEYPVPVCYKGLDLDCGFRIDLWVARQVIVELKAVEQMIPVFEAQIMTYMKLTGCRLGLLINFNVPRLKQGIKRIILD